MNKSPILMAIDPGGTTGIAFRLADQTIITIAVTDSASLWAYFANPQWRPDYVIFEIFATGGRVDKYMIYTIELVGGIKALCHGFGIKGYAHVPQKRKAFIAGAKTILHATRKPFVIHEVDALAHLLAFEYRRDHGLITA